jgi:hypothetical protein
VADDPDSEIILEIHVVGAAQQVRAISGSDGLEVSFPAPASALRTDIERLARAKLAFVRKSRPPSGGGTGGGSGDGPPTGGGRGGILA